jgi:ABC-type branched-subunit amino acid transport system substrate-binding protein
VHDDSLSGRELASQAAAIASAHGLSVARVEEAAAGEASYAGLAAKVAAEKPNAVAYLGLAGPSAGLALGALTQALPGTPIYGSNGLASATATSDAELPTIDLLDPILPVRDYAASARRVLSRLSSETGVAAPVDGLYGYEAMRLVLDAIEATRPDPADRTKVAAAALKPRTRKSVLGVYAVKPGGDVSNARFAAYRLASGRLEYLGTRDARRTR